MPCCSPDYQPMIMHAAPWDGWDMGWVRWDMLDNFLGADSDPASALQCICMVLPGTPPHTPATPAHAHACQARGGLHQAGHRQGGRARQGASAHAWEGGRGQGACMHTTSRSCAVTRDNGIITARYGAPVPSSAHVTAWASPVYHPRVQGKPLGSMACNAHYIPQDCAVPRRSLCCSITWAAHACKGGEAGQCMCLSGEAGRARDGLGCMGGTWVPCMALHACDGHRGAWHACLTGEIE